MFETGLLTRVFADEEFEEKFEEVVANLASKRVITLRMAKEVMARSFEGCSIETGLTVERNAIQWLSNSPESLEARAAFLGKGDEFTKAQKQRNIHTDVKR